MRTKTVQQKTPLEREADYLRGGGYSVIDPSHNAINAILADLGKANLSPREVEELCQTAKCAGLNGFTRIDQLPCGCHRIYKGTILSTGQDSQNFTIRIGGIEGVKPCARHTAIIESIRLKELKL